MADSSGGKREDSVVSAGCGRFGLSFAPKEIYGGREPEKSCKPVAARLITTGSTMANELAAKECIPCKGGIPPLKGRELADLYSQLGAGWKVVDEHHLEKEFTFKNFREALAFTNQIGELAEQQSHHPDIYLSWGKVGVMIWTHKIDGLTESDFILAAKIDTLEKPQH
jgi:4a-hydroxytetrahydrobiopterin dehydratase